MCVERWEHVMAYSEKLCV